MLRLPKRGSAYSGCKEHALQRGVEASSGEWILMSDADVYLAPSILRRVVAYAEQEMGQVPTGPHDAHLDWVITPTKQPYLRLSR